MDTIWISFHQTLPLMGRMQVAPKELQSQNERMFLITFDS